MTHNDENDVLDELVLDPSTLQTCRPRYDELLLSCDHQTEALVVLVYRSRKRGQLRVIQLAREGDCWWLVIETCVPITPPAQTEPPGQLDYPPRVFHFVPGSGEAPAWVDRDRPTRPS